MTPATAQAAAPLAAESFQSNPIVRTSIDNIIGALQQAQQSMTTARPATADREETFQSYLDRVASYKGKPPLFPYVGSGVGNGPLVELADGSVKWDMICGIGVHAFGHSDPDLVATALWAAMGDTVMQGNLQFNHDSTEFAELLVKEASRTSRIKHAFLTNSGAMANESALKVCYQKNAPASRVIAFEHCFMGRSTTLAQIGDSAGGRVGLPLNVSVDYVPFFDEAIGNASIDEAARRLRAYIARHPGQHACFVFELVQGEGGFNTAPREFFTALMDICKEHGIAVWIDEIQTFGRTESMFHFEQMGLGEYVDVVTIGKMSQICAALYTEEYAPKPGLLSGTFIGSTVAINVGRRLLERLRDGGYYGSEGKNAILQRAFRKQAQTLIARHPDWFPAVRDARGIEWPQSLLATGIGGMMRITPFGGDRNKVTQLMHTLFEEGVISFYCGHGPFHLRFLPPFGVMEPAHLDEVFVILDRAMARIAKA